MTVTYATPESSQFDGTLFPPELRGDVDTMSWTTFTATYAPTSGPMRLGRWECADRSSTRLGPRTFEATLALGDRIETVSATANGPVAALTEMLHQRGMAVEVLSFHQRQAVDTTATFIRGTDGRQAKWAMGCSPDPTQSALAAVIACANRLYDQRG